MDTAAPPLARARLFELLRTRAFARRRVILASGRESDFFIDCKQVVLTAEGHALVGELMLEALARISDRPLAVAGVELGGCPLASAVSIVSFLKGAPLDAIYVRKEAKTHGTGRLLEGNEHLARGAKIAILEDVVTSGGSTLKAADKLRGGGYDVTDVVALVDRLEGGGEALAVEGLSLHALYTRMDFSTP